MSVTKEEFAEWEHRMDLKTIRCSSLPLAFTCPGSLRGDGPLIDVTHDASADGTAVHAGLASVVRGMAPEAAHELMLAEHPACNRAEVTPLFWAGVAIEAPSDADMKAAQATLAQAEQHAASVEKGRKAHDASAHSCVLGDEMTEAQKAADNLDAIVATLTTKAPAELAARTEMIQGLTFTDDGGLALDGVVLDCLSGQEAIDFCVQVAKRAHPKCKLLTADKLEQLDPDSLEAFVKMATADRWQFIGTRVEAGEMVIELLEPEAETAPNHAGD